MFLWNLKCLACLWKQLKIENKYREKCKSEQVKIKKNVMAKTQLHFLVDQKKKKKSTTFKESKDFSNI